MPRIPVDECPAGPVMDAAVAEALGKIVKWEPDESGKDWPKQYFGCIGSSISGITEVWENVPSYSTDIAAAEILWDELAEDHWVVSVCYGPGRDGRNYASVQMQLDKFLAVDLVTRNPRDMDAKAETKSHAISRAFLKANGVEYVEVPE